MDYSSLILMERDAETGFVTKELGSYQVSVEAEYVKGFYVKGDTVYIKFDTKFVNQKIFDAKKSLPLLTEIFYYLIIV